MANLTVHLGADSVMSACVLTIDKTSERFIVIDVDGVNVCFSARDRAAADQARRFAHVLMGVADDMDAALKGGA